MAAKTPLWARRLRYRCIRAGLARNRLAWVGLVLLLTMIWFFNPGEAFTAVFGRHISDPFLSAAMGHDITPRFGFQHTNELPKGWLRLKRGQVTVAGFSNGADFAHQVHMQYPEKVNGACIFAGQPFHCAVTYFKGSDPLVVNMGGNRRAVPHCYNCPHDWVTLSYDHCKAHPEVVDVSSLINYVVNVYDGVPEPSEYRNIDQRVYLFRGMLDKCYLKGSVAAVQGLYSALLPDPNKQILFNNTIDTGHYVPLGFESGHWKGDVPKQCLEHVVTRGRKLRGDPADLNPNNIVSFDQSKFEREKDKGLGIGKKVWVYAPERCQTRPLTGRARGGQDSLGEPCKLMVYFNACGGGARAYDTNGFERWADEAGLVIVIPTVVENKCSSNKGLCGSSVERGCWDAYGQFGDDYIKRSAPHMHLFESVLDYVLARSAVE